MTEESKRQKSKPKGKNGRLIFERKKEEVPTFCLLPFDFKRSAT
jgi:hypothetical protein